MKLHADAGSVQGAGGGFTGKDLSAQGTGAATGYMAKSIVLKGRAVARGELLDEAQRCFSIASSPICPRGEASARARLVRFDGDSPVLAAEGLGRRRRCAKHLRADIRCWKTMTSVFVPAPTKGQRPYLKLVHFPHRILTWF